MVDGDVDEDARGEAHGDGEDPVGHPALRGGVDDDADAHADGAGDGESEGVGEAREQGPVREHTEQRDAHGDRREDLVQADGPQRLPRVRLGLCIKFVYSVVLCDATTFSACWIKMPHVSSENRNGHGIIYIPLSV